MSAGKLRTRAQLQDPVEVTGDEGEIDRTWLTVGSRWIDVEPLSGREYWMAQQVNSQVTHKVRMRYERGVTNKQRFLLSQYENGAVLNIAAVLPSQKKDWMDLLCVEPKGNG